MGDPIFNAYNDLKYTQLFPSVAKWKQMIIDERRNPRNFKIASQSMNLNEKSSGNYLNVAL